MSPNHNSSNKNHESEDRYSRLVALERMGVVQNYSSIKEKTVILIGIGGIGSSAAEMLVRCGIGKLIIFDYDLVEMANMNRLFYTPKHLGQSKVKVCEQVLKDINPDVILEPYECNICYNYDLLLNKIRNGSIENQSVDLLLCCVDNFAARVTISQVCNETNQCWMNSGVSENSVSGQIQTCLPGYSACFQCAPPFIVATKGNEKDIKRDLVCTASLPTTMGIIAGLLIQNSLKYMLKFGKVSWYQGYNCINDFFPAYTISPSPDCIDKWCKIRQIEALNSSKEIQSNLGQLPKEIFEKDISHEQNDWNIEVVDDTNLESLILEEDSQILTSKNIDSNEASLEISLEEATKLFEKLMNS